MTRLGSWDEVSAFAQALPGTEAATYYGQPAVKVAANGRTFISMGREPGSFVLMIDQGTKDMLIETEPATYWQTPHYDGWPALLVRLDPADPERACAMIGRAYEQAQARPRSRSKQ